MYHGKVHSNQLHYKQQCGHDRWYYYKLNQAYSRAGHFLVDQMA